MMNWGYGNGMMGVNSGFGFFGTLTYLVVLVDLILLGIFLWKKISK